MLEKYFIIRTCGLFGVRGCMGKGGGNFVENILNSAKTNTIIRVVGDQIVAPTYTLDLAKKLSQLIRTNEYGTYHITNSGSCSWYEYAKKIFELTGTKVKLEKASTAEYKAKAARPAFSILEHKNLRRIGLDDMRGWDKALKAYLIEARHING